MPSNKTKMEMINFGWLSPEKMDLLKSEIGKMDPPFQNLNLEKI